MRILLAFLLLVSCNPVFAMKGSVALRMAVGAPSALNTASTNVTTGAWVELAAATTFACSGLLLHNSGAQPIKLGIGAASSEVDLGIVLPVGVAILVPQVVSKGSRISVRSIGATQSSGIITMSCFQ